MPPGAAGRPTVTVVANPRAGRGRAGVLLPRVADALRAGLPDTAVEVITTSDFEDARRRTREVVASARPVVAGEPPDSLVVMGGDGMAHLGVDACAGTSVRLGVVPAGTGNDFCRGIGIPTSLPSAVRAIGDGHVEQVDVNRAQGPRGTDSHVGCAVSTGYDARVNRRANEARFGLGSLSYGWAALAELAAFRPMDYRLTIDGERRDLSAILVAVANGAYFGGGMQIAPDASVTDGQLDLTIIHPVGRGTLLRLLPTLYNGGFVHHRVVERLRAREVVVEGADAAGGPMYAMADGELLGDVPVTVTVEPRALSVYLPVRPTAASGS